MASIYLIRHGQASFGSGDYDVLSEVGLRQARLAGDCLAQIAGPVRRIVSGSMKRQRQTAEAIAGRLSSAGAGEPGVEIDSRLDELDIDLHFDRIVPLLEDRNGELQELVAQSRSSSRAYQKLLKRTFLRWQSLTEVPDGLESWDEFSRRVAAVLSATVRSAAPGDNTVLVTSGGVIATLVQQVLGLPDSGAYPLFEAMRNCSITHLLHDRERVSLSSFNDCSYLSAGGTRGAEQSLLTYR